MPSNALSNRYLHEPLTTVILPTRKGGSATTIPLSDRSRKGPPRMLNRMLGRRGVLCAAVASVVLVSGCGAANKGSTASSTEGASLPPTVAVLLPDGRSADRWTTLDQPQLASALSLAKVPASFANAQNDPGLQVKQADEAIAKGVRVLILTAVDTKVGTEIEARAARAGVDVIAYDRLNPGGSAKYFVGFDNEIVGQQMGEALEKCVGDRDGARVIELHGDPGDNNASEFKAGYSAALKGSYAAGWRKAGSKAVKKWDPDAAALLFEAMLAVAGGEVDGVIAANDGLADAVIDVLDEKGISAPVTGQDATVVGIQNVLSGKQCVTVYKPVKTEAEAAAQLAISMAKGTPPPTTTTVFDRKGIRDVKAVLLKSHPLTLSSGLNKPFEDGALFPEQVCTEDYLDLCRAHGLIG